MGLTFHMNHQRSKKAYRFQNHYQGCHHFKYLMRLTFQNIKFIMRFSSKINKSPAIYTELENCCKHNLFRICLLRLYDIIKFNLFQPSGLFYLNSLDRSVSSIRGAWLVLLLSCFVEISELNAV